MDLPISKDFKIPEGFSTDKFKIRILKVTDVVKDYDAEVYMWSRINAFKRGFRSNI